MKIRTRLSIQYILITIGIYSLSMLFVYRQFKKHKEDQFYEALESNARVTAEMVLLNEEELQTVKSGKADLSSAATIVNTSIYNNEYRRIFTLDSLYPIASNKILKSIPADQPQVFSNGDYQGIGLEFISARKNKYYVLSEGKLNYIPLIKLRNILLIGTLLTLIAVALGAWFISDQSMRPIVRINKEINEILPADLSRRLKVHASPDEFSVLVKTFNLLLDRIETAFNSEKSYISNVSHELKNPLTAIQSQIQYALNKDRKSDEYKKILTSVREDTADLSNTVEKLLQLARINSIASPDKMETFRLDELIYDVQDSFTRSFPEFHLELNITDLPPEEEGMEVFGNYSLLKSSCINLLENAGKFSNDHASKWTIDFKDPGGIKMEIQNNGNPIKADDQDKIFRPFYRSQSNIKIKGSGIGLSLVKTIMDLHHIDIKLQSDEINGTRFIFIFPIKKNTQV
ncbi:MAG: HAMP domain-containing sensor histidine kinase [Saprospiraceae bacterium]